MTAVSEPIALDSQLRSFEERLVWIFGSPRTGSSWLMKLLSECPEILTIDETYVPLHLVPVGHTVADGEYLEAGVRADDSNFFFARRYLAELRPELRGLILRGLQRQVRELGAGSSPRWVVIKEPNGSHGADTTLSLLPRSRMLFLLRDGRDVLDSLTDALLGRDSWWRRSQQGIANKVTQQRLAFLRQHANLWLERTNSVQRAFRALPEEQRLLVRYEELLNDTPAGLSRVFRWLRLNADAQEVARIVARHAFDAIPDQEKGPGKMARAASPGLWRERFTAEEQQLLEEVMGDKLRELGYSTESEGVISEPQATA
jgi:Sulfotransferase family